MAATHTEVYGIVIAAGASRRMGTPKLNLLVPHPGADQKPPGTLLERHVHGLLGCCTGVVVVLGASEPARPLPGRCQVIRNPDWATTHQADSIARGLSEIPGGAHVIFTPVDVPPAPGWVLDLLLSETEPRIAGHLGSPGHPVSAGAEILRSALKTGHLGHGLKQAGAEIIDTGWRDCLRNLNTPNDWRSWLEGE